MILSGDPIPAKDALAAGSGRRDHRGRSGAGAVAFARKVLAEKRPLVRVKDREDKLKDVRANPAKVRRDRRAACQEDARPACAGRRDRGDQADARYADRRGAEEGARYFFMQLVGRRSVEGAAPHLLRRARGRQGPGHRQGRAAARDQARRGDRRRHHGRRHLDELRQCRHSGDDHREQRGRAQARHGDDREELPDLGAARLAQARGHAEAACAVHADHRPERLEGRRHRDRGGVRGDGDQEGAVRQAREDRQARRGARDQHLLSQCRRDRAA